MKFLSAIFLTAAIAPIAADTGKTEPMSIIDLAAADGKYGTLLSAVTNTPGVLDAVVGAMPVTIFGPTDAAFAAIADTVAGLDEATLAGILAGHVVAGVFSAQMVIDAGCVELMTLAGDNVRVMYANGKVMVNQATVIQPDIIGEGGVIHGIDTVILPGTFEPCPSSGMATGKGAKKMSGKGGKGGSAKMASSKGSSSKSGKAGSKGSKKAGKGGKGGSTPTVAAPVAPTVSAPVAPAPVAPAPVASPVSVSVPVSIPVSQPVAVSVPVSQPVSAAVPVSQPVSAVVQVPVSRPTSAPVRSPTRPPTRPPTPAPVPVPVGVPVIMPVGPPVR